MDTFNMANYKHCHGLDWLLMTCLGV